MEIDERIDLAKSLISKREEIDNQLAALFSGQSLQKRQQKCRECGEVGHRADTCPRKEEKSQRPPLPAAIVE